MQASHVTSMLTASSTETFVAAGGTGEIGGHGPGAVDVYEGHGG